MSGGRPAADYTWCPTCKRRTVLFHFGRNGEDYYRCSRRDCAAEFYAEPEHWDRDGRALRDAWRELNQPE